MAPKRPLDATLPEEEAALWLSRMKRSRRFRLKRTVLVVMWLMCGPSGTARKRRERKRPWRWISQVVCPWMSMLDVSSEPPFVPLDYLREITDDFSEERKLGSGSFGEVYLGVDQDGQKIAVKRIYQMAGVDDGQFQNEFTNLARLKHRNIVRLVGYCNHIQEVPAMYEGKFVLAEKIHRALCLEYMSNGSLQKYISDECNKYDWRTGYGIIKGICQGLKCLHIELKPPIYHLDLKPANVLLDENMVPRLADFGISRLFGDERTRATKSILGTQGYLPPEYIHNNLISSKFDIFSLGVVIIKIMSGRAGYSKITDMSPQEFTNLVQEKWTNRLHETSSLMKAYSKQVKTCIQIGLMCVNDDRHKRPSIQDIVNRLNETETECTYAARKDGSLIYQIPEDDSITFMGASLTGQQNGHFSFSTTDAPGTSYPVAGGVSLGISSPNHVPVDMSSEPPSDEFDETDQGIAPANNGEVPNSNNQPHGYEHDGGKWQPVIKLEATTTCFPLPH
ncbi:cysteine-rich receptor-like protein kinase 44 isoform X3 [Aegilops tauschii subsp. strangulata]|uniref:Protein kinase domain-containing protein n=1 Tax=Aegilops tauschii subsp. strangulata TaxID=200361 RepID=A0A453LYF9_AEGTS